jgi:photosynthetic reaction center cytochrome c subunit
MNWLRLKTVLAASVLAFAVAGCEVPPQDFTQTGYRGLGIEDNNNRQTVFDSVQALAARIPQTPPQIPKMEPAPAGTYQNVQVLGHLSAVEFNLFMQSLVEWVAKDEGCAYCHVQTADSVNYASDANYTKIVSRRMIQMTQDINTNWAAHVGEEKGVNCWTCHQSNPVPTNYWFYTDENQPLRNYLDREGARVQGPYIFSGPGQRNRQSINQTVYTYQLMTHMSNALGVNCTFCHNTARFADWDESSPKRVTALRGLRMVRHLNTEYLVPLQAEWPDYRLGPMGDGPKLQCSTCHQGANLPQYGTTASRGTGWPGITQIGYPNPSAEAETTDGG